MLSFTDSGSESGISESRTTIGGSESRPFTDAYR
jgi:hypothetical protein